MIKVIIAGDFCDHGRVSEKIEGGEYGILFDDIKPILRDSDFKVLNFEFPIVQGEGNPIRKAGPVLRGQEKSIDAIKYAGFNVCTLANNHILDQGAECCLNTKKLLEKSGVRTVGVGEDISQARDVLYLEKDHEKLAVINCCENEFSIATKNTGGANPINPVQQYYKILEAKKKADYVIVIAHGGAEYCQIPTPRMKELYHYFVEIGADAVINHHQHCYSGFEVYKNKPIFYGLGNLLFDWDGRRNGTWNEGYMTSLNFQEDGKVTFDLISYTQCNDRPSVKINDEKNAEKFNSKLDNINRIIKDDDLLLKEWQNWIENNSKYFLLDFQPYNNRFLKALFIRGLLPSFITERKKYSIMNHITCESHLERTKYIISKL